jgi:hypothetical protein
LDGVLTATTEGRRRPRPALLAAIATLLLASACHSDNLDNAFQRLHLSKFALGFPSSQEDLDRCVKNNDKQCLDLVAEARMGKERLLALAPENALDRTLETIVAACPSSDQSRQEVCLGAIIALYLFNAPEQDLRIRQALLKADRLILRRALNPSLFAWCNNRPKPEAWVEALKALPADHFPDGRKDAVIKGFAEPSPGANDGVRLL